MGSCIILVGPKHAGKTSAGLVLADLCGGDFIDLDILMETQTRKSPRELYLAGPELFRAAEAAALKTVLGPREPDGSGGCGEGGGKVPVRIIAAGGGIIDNPEAMDLLKAAGSIGPGLPIMVYLEVSPETAWERISRGELPPFLRTGNPRAAHAELHRRRGARYREAACLTIPAEGKSPEDIGREIIRRLGQR